MAYNIEHTYPRKLCEKTLTLTDAPKYVLKPYCWLLGLMSAKANCILNWIESREKVVFMAFFVTFLLLQATGK